MLFRYATVVLLCFGFIVKCNLQEYASESDENQGQTEEPTINETNSEENTDTNATIEEDGATEHKIASYPCTNYQNISNSVLSESPSVLNVTSEQLAEILQDNTIANRCAIVYFYASWSYYSCEYALQYNALGRAFNSLPILAVDLSYNDVYVCTFLLVFCFSFVDVQVKSRICRLVLSIDVTFL